MLPLQGIGVIVTRPEQQAMPLCRLFEAQGAVTLRLPAIEIRPYDDRASNGRVGSIDGFDLIVFTSTNAVRFGGALFDRVREPTIAAIGPATVRALNEVGLKVAIRPEGRFDSEALLAHPHLRQLAGKHILLIKGRDGRDLLAREFERRGAKVTSLDVYERVPVRHADADFESLQAQMDAGRLQVITATSLDVATHLLQMLPAAAARRLHWLVPGERIATGLRERGLDAIVITAASAEDQDLLAALVRWRSE